MAWRRRFPYLRVQPSAVIECEDDANESPSVAALPSAAAKAGFARTEGASRNSADANLIVLGRSLALVAAPVSLPDAEEEVLALHGTIEEFIAVDAAAEAREERRDTDRADSVCSPLSSMRQEVISDIFDALWPDIVQALHPLIHRLARLPLNTIKPAADERSDATEYGNSDW